MATIRLSYWKAEAIHAPSRKTTAVAITVIPVGERGCRGAASYGALGDRTVSDLPKRTSLQLLRFNFPYLLVPSDNFLPDLDGYHDDIIAFYTSIFLQQPPNIWRNLQSSFGLS